MLRVSLMVTFVAGLGSQAGAATCDLGGAVERPRIERAPDGRSVRISYRARLLVPLGAVERMLADPASYHQWLPGVGQAARTADGFRAVYQLPWPLGRVVELIRVERKRMPGGIAIAWHRLAGDFPRDEACWHLRAVDATTTEVAYSAELQLHRWVPVALVRRAERAALVKAAADLERGAADLP